MNYVWGFQNQITAAGRNVTTYLPYGQQPAFAGVTNSSYVGMYINRPTVVKNLRVYASGTNATDVFTIMIATLTGQVPNAATATPVTATVVAGNIASDTTHSATFPAGTLMSLRLTDNNAASTLSNVIVIAEAY
jgi:hypothetical protein